MEESMTKNCERVVASHLPFYFRKGIHVFVLLVYLYIQFQVCTICAIRRHNLTICRVAPVGDDEMDVANTKAIVVANLTTNLTTSFADTNVANISTTTANSNSANPNTDLATRVGDTHLYYTANSVANDGKNFTDAISANVSLDLTSGRNATSSRNDTSVRNNTVVVKEAVSPLYAHIFVVVAFQSGVHILIYVLRSKYQLLFGYAVAYLNYVIPADVEDSLIARSRYVQKDRNLSESDEKILKTALTLKEKSFLFRWRTAVCFWNPRAQCFRLTCPSIECTLADYMFSDLSCDGFQILGSIEMIYDAMKALDYLHYRNNYHLDLRPENVKLHCNGLKVYVKLSNFNFMKKSMDKKISSASVGLKDFYRPPECSADQEVDAEKCDMWGLGMISLDLFTGGMFRIKSETGGWDLQNNDSIIRDFIRRRPFLGYVQGAYRVIEMFMRARFNSEVTLEVWSNPRNFLDFGVFCGLTYPYQTYEVNHLNFMHNIRCFVYRLLLVSPRRRMALERAFNEPLMAYRGMPTRKVRHIFRNRL